MAFTVVITHRTANGHATDVPGDEITLKDLLDTLTAKGETVTIERVS